MFSFVLLDESVIPSRIIAARDPIGITTLYQGWSSKRPGAVYFASELKALVGDCDKIIAFPPGHVFDSRDNSTTRYYKPSWWDGDLEGDAATIPTTQVNLDLIRTTLEDAVRKRLMSEVPYGVLLSGGLDSSLVASIAARETEKVAQAQYELRQKKLREIASGSSTLPSPLSTILTPMALILRLRRYIGVLARTVVTSKVSRWCITSGIASIPSWTVKTYS